MPNRVKYSTLRNRKIATYNKPQGLRKLPKLTTRSKVTEDTKGEDRVAE